MYIVFDCLDDQSLETYCEVSLSAWREVSVWSLLRRSLPIYGYEYLRSCIALARRARPTDKGKLKYDRPT